ncbi:hypothetical protein N9164_08840 [Draconibacterium sp.]|nr:hypothetical protein [Draconibacterium sp.]
MKKIFLLLGVVMMSFAISSCGLIDDATNCEKNLDIAFEIYPWATVVENGKETSGYNVTFEVIKWKCSGGVTPMGINTYMTDVAGEVNDIDYGFNLNNNNDYVTVEIVCYGKYDFQEAEPQTVTYTYDSSNTTDGKKHRPYAVFDYTVEY